MGVIINFQAKSATLPAGGLAVVRPEGHWDSRFGGSPAVAEMESMKVVWSSLGRLCGGGGWAGEALSLGLFF
jgi:hypothetical protein